MPDVTAIWVSSNAPPHRPKRESQSRGTTSRNDLGLVSSSRFLILPLVSQLRPDHAYDSGEVIITEPAGSPLDRQGRRHLEQQQQELRRQWL